MYSHVNSVDYISIKMNFKKAHHGAFFLLKNLMISLIIIIVYLFFEKSWIERHLDKNEKNFD